MPTVLDGFRNETFNKEVFLEFGKNGLLGPFIEGYGCAGSVGSTRRGIGPSSLSQVPALWRTAS